MGTEEIKKEMNAANWFSQLAYDRWVPIPVSGARPSARYKVMFVTAFKTLNADLYDDHVTLCCHFFQHAAAVADDDGKLYIAGGSRTGRYLPDVQVYDVAGVVCLLWKVR